MQFNFKKIDNNKYEYKAPDGTIKYYDDSALVKLRSKGHEVIVDGKQYYITPQNATATPAAAPVVYNFNTTDYKKFTYEKANQPSDVSKLIANLKKGLKLTVNKNEIKLSKDGTTIEFVDYQAQQQYLKIINKQFEYSKQNIDSINAANPTATTSVVARNVIQNADGTYIYKNQIITKEKIKQGLENGKSITINGRLIMLNKDRTDFVFVDPDEINRILRSKQNTPPINLTYVDHDNFFYEKLNRNITRGDVFTNLRNGKHITINGRELAITPDGLDFAYVEEVEQMKKNLKSEAEINKEAEASDVKIVRVPDNLPNYFATAVTLGEEEPTPEEIKSTSYGHMKDLQERLFFLAANSNVVNVETKGINNSFDLINFINRYEKLSGKKGIFKDLFSSTPVYFDLSGKSNEARKLWNQILALNQAANDSLKEYDDTFLNIGYPFISDTIIEKGDEAKKDVKPIQINAPLFFLKTRLMLNTKERQFRLFFDKVGTDFSFKANKELLLYLATQLKKHPNTLKYDALFDDNRNVDVPVLIKEMKQYFTALDVMFDAQALENILYQMDSCEVVSPEVSIQKNKSGQVTNGVRIVPSCFIGVFKQTNADISKDIDKILEKPEGREFWSTLDSLVPEQLQYFEEKGKDFREQDLRQIVELDYSQKTACKLALKGSLNIVGPAGTGKSQTISNILANFIDKHESALFCAEKKTATDVVSNRMKNLRYYILPLFAKENWNETLTKALRQNLKRVGTIYGQWEPLHLDDDENRKDPSSAILDANFTKIAKYRETMSSKDGYSLPKTIIDFSTGEMQKQVKAVEELCFSIFKNSDNAVDFWNQINEAKHAKDLWKNIQLILQSINDPEITGDSEEAQKLLNKLFKAIKYYNSPTLFEDELIQILQEDYNENPIVNNPDMKKNDHFDSFISEPRYIKFKNILRSLINTQAPALNMISECNGYVTYDTIKALKAKDQLSKLNGTTGQLPSANSILSSVPQNTTISGANPLQPGVQPIPEKVELTDEEKIDKFVSMYNSKNFKFNDIYKYYKSQKKLNALIKEKNEKAKKEALETNSEIAPENVAVDLNLDNTKWFDETNTEMQVKINNDLKLAELHFLEHVRTTIRANTSYISQYNQLYGIVDNNERLENVQEIFKKFGQIISLLFPIIIASPNLVCKYMNPSRKVFKHIVIDEASMLSLERAIPLLFRGDQYVIVGDSKQLKPLSCLEQRRRVEELRELVAAGKAKPADLKAQEKLAREFSGVLDFMAPHIPKTTLQYHYRALKTECVKFSSVVFYDKEMIIADKFKDHDAYLNAGLKVINVNGDYKNGINIKECDALYEKLVEIARKNKDILDSDEKISVGIIVFTQEQKNYLDNLIIQKADPDVLNMKMMLNTKTGEDTSLFIKDIETVQGDERDIILLSLGSSSKSKLSIVESLGLINSDLGNNFLNVMITRARQQLVIFKSFEANDIPATGQVSVDYYRDFIKYIDLLAQPDGLKVRSELDNLFKPYELRSATIDYSSLVTLEKEYLTSDTGLIDLLKQHIDQTKYDIKTNVEPIQGQKFGLVAVDKITKIPEFALIFDEFIKDIYKTPKQSQFYDYLFLGSRGWQFHKITSLEWAYVLSDKDVENAKLDFVKEKLTFKGKCYYVESQPVPLAPVEEAKAESKEVKKPVKKVAKKPSKKAPVKKATKKPTKKGKK